ncbi:MAG: HTTM domain-containing protein [Bacteriovoracia bacterium]
MKKAIAAWDNFFFQERPTEGIALFRIMWMGLIFLYFILDLANIQDFYGPHAIVSLTTVRDQFPYLQASLFHFFKPGYDAVYAIMTVYGLSLLASIFGLFTRTSLLIALICMTSLHQRNIWLLSSSELLMRTITFLLIFSPCAHSLSVDAFLGRYFPSFRQKKEWSFWSVRLIQIQISVIYLWTFWHKLKGETWIDGTAVYYATRLEHLSNSSLPWLMDSTWFLAALTWGTLILEFSLGILIWFKELRRPVIIAGVIFHLGIEYTMSIPFFELFMITLLVNFFTPEEMRGFVLKMQKTFIQGINESTISEGMKEKIIKSIRGQHETAN